MTILRITDDTDTVDLYSLDYSLNTNGWAPSVDDEGDVPESLSINILNGVQGGGTAAGSKWRFAQNKAKLKRLLRNAQASGLGDSSVAPVRIEWEPQHGDPAQLWASRVVGWDETTFLPPTVSDAEGQTAEQYNNVTLNIVRRAPWLQTSYIYPNLLAGSADMANWTGTPNALSTAPIDGLYGGTSRIRSPQGAAQQNAYSAGFSVTNGQTYSVVLTYGSSASPGASVSVFLRNTARSAIISNIASPAISPNIDVEDGVTISATLVATSTDAGAHLEILQAVGVGQHMDFAEVLVINNATGETWHPTYAELTEVGPTADDPAPAIAELIFTGEMDTPSPYTLIMSNLDTALLTTIQPGYIIATDQPSIEGMELRNWTLTPSGAFTNPADTTRKALGGTVNRYTPATTARTGSGTTAINEPWRGRIQVFAGVCNNSATATYWLQAELSAQNLTAPTRRIEIPPAATAIPQVICLGEVAAVDELTHIQLWYEVSATGAGTLDVDYIVLLRMTDQTFVIPHGTFSVSTYATGTYELEINPRSLTSVAPVLRVNSLADPDVTVQPDYRRSDIRLTMMGKYLSVIWLAPYSSGGVNYWRHVDSTGSHDPIAPQFSAVRLPATDVPL